MTWSVLLRSHRTARRRRRSRTRPSRRLVTRLCRLTPEALDRSEHPGYAVLDESRLTLTQLRLLKTNLPDSVRSSSEEAVSVIHAPESFHQWVCLNIGSLRGTAKKLKENRHRPTRGDLQKSQTISLARLRASIIRYYVLRFLPSKKLA